MNSYCYAYDSGDSVVRKFPEINVEAYKIISNKELIFNSSTILSKSAIQEAGTWQISQVLENQPGIFIKDYGGLGGLKTISTRGTNSSQTLIMLDGMKINSNQSGSLDLSVIPVSLLNNIEVIRNGSSGLFGGNAIGGIINLNTPDSKTEKFIFVDFRYGSFNELLCNSNFSLPISDIILSGGIEYTGSKGNYPFKFNQFGTNIDTSRDNSDYKNLNIFLTSFIPVNNWEIKTTAIGRISRRGTPSAVLQGFIEASHARLDEDDITIISNLKRNISEKEIFSIGILARVNRFDYSDPESLPNFTADTTTSFTNRDIQLNLNYEKDINFGILFFSLESEYCDLRSDTLQNIKNGTVSRLNFAASGRLLFDLISTTDILIKSHIGLRFDDISSVGSAFSPVFGLMMSSINYPVSIKFQASYNFRPPSFNEMYYLNYGTSDLKPEKSLSLNFGLMYKPFDFIYFEASTFLISTKDQIETIRKTENSYSSKNVDEVLSTGLELTTEIFLFHKNLSIIYNYTLQSTIDNSLGSYFFGKQLEYVPKELISAKVVYRLNDFYAGLSFEYTSYLYSSPENYYESIIPAHKQFNINLSYLIESNQIKFKLKLDLLNMLDERYCIINNYPMPGRIVRAGIGFDL